MKISTKFFVLIVICFFIQVHSLFAQEKRSLKILMVVGHFPQLPETFVVNQITGLLDRGHDVKIFAIKGIGDLEKIHPEVIKYKLLDRVYYQKCPINYNFFDVIICQFGPLGSIFATLKKREKFYKKLITCFRGCDISSGIRKTKKRYQVLFEQADLLLPVCHHFAERLQTLGADSKKIQVLHSVIDCKKFKFKKREFLSDGIVQIVSTGRLIEKKGFEYAIRAIARVHEINPHVHYTIIGSGPLEQDLKNLIINLDAGSYITLVGSKTSDQVYALLDQSHIFILPSVTASDEDQEGIPNVLKEAFAVGLPVISTLHSGISELVDDGKSGFLVAERDVDALVDRMNYLIQHPEHWEAMGRYGRKKVEQEFELDKENDRLEELLLKLTLG